MGWVEPTAVSWKGQRKHLLGQQTQIVTIHAVGDTGPPEVIVKFNALLTILYEPSLTCPVAQKADLYGFHYGAFLVSGFHWV